MMTWYDKTYVIVNVVDITQDMIDECIQTSMDTLRKNVAETQAVLKWYSREDMPTTIAALDPVPTTYTNAEILIELDDPAWIPEEE